MNVKNIVVVLISLFFVSSLTLGIAMAGDENYPEVDDSIGDTENSDLGFRDIAAAWFGEDDEGNYTIISLKMAGSPPGLMDLANNPDTTTYEYEVYFDVGGQGYAVCAIIQYAASIGAGTPLGGVYSTTGQWLWELRTVKYNPNTDIIQSESYIGDVSINDYHSETVILEWTVNKEEIGIAPGFEGRGQALVNTWAAIWNADDYPSGSQRNPADAWDYAHTHFTYPGDPYYIQGVGSVDYNITLSCSETEKETYGGTPVKFLVTAYNGGTHNFLVDFNFLPSDESWLVELSPNSTTINKDNTRTISVTITPPKNVKNGTLFAVVIGGDIHEVDGNDDTVPILVPLPLMVIGLENPNATGEDSIWDILMDNLAIIVGVIAVVVVAVVVLVVLIRR
jgi:hypothetical protein